MVRIRTTILGATVALSFLSACNQGGKWVEAPDTLAMYERMDRVRQMQERVEANKAPTSEGRSCSDLLGQMREHIAAAEADNILFRRLVRNCGDLGMQFGADVRCEDGRLQVKCQ